MEAQVASGVFKPCEAPGQENPSGTLIKHITADFFVIVNATQRERRAVRADAGHCCVATSVQKPAYAILTLVQFSIEQLRVS